MYKSNILIFGLIIAINAQNIATKDDGSVKLIWFGASWWPECQQFSGIIDQVLAKKEFNDIVDWTWYPVPDGSGITPYDCSNCNGTDCSKEVCQVDHIEACTVHVLCPYNQTSCDKANQMAQSKFVGCMEWDHQKDPGASHASDCANKAGISFADYDKIHECANSPVSAEVMDFIAKQSNKAKVQYYPDIRLDGSEAQGDYTTVKGFETMICDAYKGSDSPCK